MDNLDLRLLELFALTNEGVDSRLAVEQHQQSAEISIGVVLREYLHKLILREEVCYFLAGYSPLLSREFTSGNLGALQKLSCNPKHFLDKEALGLLDFQSLR